MSLISALIIAIVQGITEWLPVSSSGHIVLFSNLLHFSNTIAFDVALHFGTLMAVFVYFGRDIMDILEDFLKMKTKSKNFRLGLLILVSSVPAAIIGYMFKKYFEAAFSSLLVVAMGFAITSLVLFIASLDLKTKKKAKEDMSYWDSLLVGAAQAVAIFPGISRSGSTISAGLLRGLDERDAIKFSFLMSIPAIFGANLLEIGNKAIPSEMIWATLLAFIVGLASIYLLMNILLKSKKNLRWFAVYCLLLAIGIGIYLVF